MKNLIVSTREYREKLLCDPYRPTYHFVQPDDNGSPGDPNGAFFADGVYHLMYLYRNSKTGGFHWGHISSVDLLHWRHHPDALTVHEGDEGCFSGGAFLDDDKTAYLTFWKFPSKNSTDNGGIAIASAKPPYDTWERLEPIAINGSPDIWGTVDLEVNGKTEHISCADPSNIWKAGGKYYMQTGNLCVLNSFGRADDSDPHYRGDWTDLFRSDDLKNWEFVHRFYTDRPEGTDIPDKSEDDMCPSFLPLFDEKENGRKTDKYLQLFIAHNKGCQYYVGSLENELFRPEAHGRMSWKDKAFFAPEALIDDKNRHIIWAWLLDNIDGDFDKYGWSSVYCFPRTVWWKNGQLYMAPAAELDRLQYGHQRPEIPESGRFSLRSGEIFRLKAKIDMSGQSKAGFSLRISEEQNCHTDIYFDKERSLLIFDAAESGAFGWKIKEEAPLTLDGDILELDIFADKSVIEVYANEKQAICRRVYPENPSEAVGLAFIGDPGSILELDAWDMAPANPY